MTGVGRILIPGILRKLPVGVGIVMLELPNDWMLKPSRTNQKALDTMPT
jgi:hypothetical protein